jgi:hypothetical protein
MRVMVQDKSPSARCGNEKTARRAAWRLTVAAALLGLGACNPVETWRDLTGASINDPDPETTPNTRNLAAGEASDYPNLATVPPPPVRAMTAAEREKLTQSLIADRANARYTDEQLRAGFPSVSAAPPPTALAATTESNPDRPLAAQPNLAQPNPAQPSPLRPSPPQAGPVAARLPSAPAPAFAGKSPGISSEAATALPSSPSPPRARDGTKTLVGPGQGLRKQGEPPEPGPMESSLEMPQARAAPQPEPIEPTPPPPQLPPTPKVAGTSSTLPGGLSAGGILARPSPPETAGFQPPPAPPELPPPQPARSAAAGAGKSNPKPTPPAGPPVAEVKFGADSTSLTEKDRQALATVVPLYQQNPGKVRVVGYAGAGPGAVEQLNSFRTALDRAQAVAAALAQAGIPADKIQVEAAPEGAASGESRAEIMLEH